LRPGGHRSGHRPADELKLNAGITVGSNAVGHPRRIKSRTRETVMSKQHEKILVATLAALVICGAAALVAQPAAMTVRPAQASASTPIDASLLGLGRAKT
jgi:hypothetical protein